MKHFIIRVLIATLATSTAVAIDYDIVILNGRVMDPETNFDGAQQCWYQR